MGTSLSPIKSRLRLSIFFIQLALLSLVLFPHSLGFVPRLDYLMVLISAVFFATIGFDCFDKELLQRYGLLAVGFGVPLLFHQNEHTLNILKELLPLGTGAYIISWMVKRDRFPHSFFGIFLSLSATGLIVAVIQQLTWDNYWLELIYGYSEIYHEANLAHDIHAPENHHIGFGFSMVPEPLGWSSLILGIYANCYFLLSNNRKRWWNSLILLILADTGMILSGWRAIWLSYFISIPVVMLLGRVVRVSALYLVIVFLAIYGFYFYQVNYTIVLSPSSLIVRGAEDRFFEFNANSVQKEYQKQLQRPSLQSRFMHCSFLLHVLSNQPLFGYGPGKYEEIIRDYNANGLISIDKSFQDKFLHTSLDPHTNFIKLLVEYGVWGVVFISAFLGWIFFLYAKKWMRKERFSLLQAAVVALFMCEVLVGFTRTLLYHNLTWFTLAFVVGSSFCSRDYSGCNRSNTSCNKL